MNRYPLWKYLFIGITLLLGFLYTIPNFYGESPAVQITALKPSAKVDDKLLATIEEGLKKANIISQGVLLEANIIKIRFADTDTQLKAKDIIFKLININPLDPTYATALNLISRSPNWLRKINALPMYLGLDLRGGIHVLLQVDMKGAVNKRLDGLASDLRIQLRSATIRHSGIAREGSDIAVRFRDKETRDKAKKIITDNQPDLILSEQTEGNEFKLVASLKPEALTRFADDALKQNISILHKRVNELGVAEPVIQQLGKDRIVVEFPGVQDSARVRELLGRTATLEIRMVDENEANLVAAMQGNVPFGSDLLLERGGQPVLVKKQAELTGDHFTDAQPSLSSQTHDPVVTFSLDASGARIFKEITRANVGKRMAIVLIEKGKSEVIIAPSIREEIGGGRVEITGRFSTEETNDLAILIRSGSLAAPMEIIEERTIGPSLGAENIAKGFNSTLGGFCAIAIFMIAYYMIFGFISVLALGANLLFLVAILSLLQATLTLPGMAAIALTLGMAIDANVLINERIREELRNGATPQAAIAAGYERAFDTILDSNATTLFAGLALLIFGSGAVRGFAVVLCLGILTSLFSAVMVSRALTNLYYGSRRKLDKIAIGQVFYK